MRTSMRSWMLAGVLVALPSCFSLARRTPPTLQFALSGPPAAASVASTGISIGVRRLTLASYLAVPSIVVRRGTHEIITSEFHRWGESLDGAINRVVAAHLASAPSVRVVDVAPWPMGAAHNFLVQLNVSHFEGVSDTGTDGHLHTQIQWDIVRPFDGRVLLRGTSENRATPWRVGDYAGLVEGLNASLAQVARDIGGCLSQFRNDSTPPASCSMPAASR